MADLADAYWAIICALAASPLVQVLAFLTAVLGAARLASEIIHRGE